MNSTQQLTHFIKNGTPCIFAKYGDGEFRAANFYQGGNCDGTPYTKNLGEKMREAFLYCSQQPNAMMGAWHDSSDSVFWEGLGNSKVNWVDFHTVLIDNNKKIDANNDRLELFKALKESDRKKIYVANPNMHKAKDLLNLDYHIQINPTNWFDTEYESVFSSIRNAISSDDETIVLTSAGMGAKYLISDLHKLYPKAIYVDIGSGLDLICTKKSTRSYNPSYTALCNYLKPILPEDWD